MDETNQPTQSKGTTSTASAPVSPSIPALDTIVLSRLRRLEIGTIVTLFLAIVGFAFWLGTLNSRVGSLESGGKIKEATANALETIRNAENRFKVGFGRSQKRDIDTWYTAEADGFLVLDVTEGGKGRIFASPDKKRETTLRSRAADSESTMILVPKGLHYKAEGTHATCKWYPFGAE